MADCRRLASRILIASMALGMTGCAAFSSSPLEEAQAAALDKRRLADQIKVEKEEPKTAAQKIEAGDRFRRQGQDDQALVSYFAAIRMDPTAAEAKERIAFIHLASDIDRAEAIFARLVEEDETNETAWRGLGLAHLAHGDLELARRALDRAIELAPDSPGAQYALASVLGLMGRPDEALPHALRALELRPRDAQIMNVVGMSYLLLKQPGKAEAQFRQAARIVPDSPSFANNLGLALGAQARYDEAFQAFLRGGSEQSAYNNLGYVYFLNGDHETAIEHYERALALPGDDDLLVIRNLNAAIDERQETVPASPAP